MGDIGNLACLSILILSITSFCCGNEVLEEIIAKRVNFDKRISDLEKQDKQNEKRIFKLEKTIGILLAEINKKSSQTDLEALKVSFLNFCTYNYHQEYLHFSNIFFFKKYLFLESSSRFWV